MAMRIVSSRAVRATRVPLMRQMSIKSGLRASQVGDEANQKDYYDKAVHYDTCWGLDNIHTGYYPHLSAHFPSSSDYAPLEFKQAAFTLNGHMINVGRINRNDTVLDVGCGKGHGPVQIARQTGAKVVGIDIGTSNIVRCKEYAAQNPELDLTYEEASFTDIPAHLKNKYSVIFAQLAINHYHTDLHSVFEEFKSVMAPGARCVFNDYLGSDRPGGEMSDDTKEHVLKRLHFDVLHGHREWRRIAEDCGFYFQYYENLDDHMVQSYKDLSHAAYQNGFKSADGAELGKNYAETVEAIMRGEIGMNLAVMTLEPRVYFNGVDTKDMNDMRGPHGTYHNCAYPLGPK